MEEIIKKSIKGGYDKLFVGKTTGEIVTKDEERLYAEKIDEYRAILDPLFWQALGKACGWITDKDVDEGRETFGKWEREGWLGRAKYFHEINLTEGWSKAVEWLSNLIEE